MAKNLADRLEALSGYRHVFPPNDPNAQLNPVAYSHLRITVGGQPYHVLSRICAAGLDYTQRSNKFAHHVVLEEKELPASGPAALLASPGFMESDWQGDPRILPAARKPPQIAVGPASCRQWQAIAGDAGWAGVLAETAANATPRNAAIIYRPGVDALSLVSEALALLPAPLRWQVTFSTFFTKLPPEVQCQWRFVLAGSPEAKALQRAPHIVTIDLSSVLGRAPEGMWMEAARTGVPPQIAVAPQPEPKAAQQRPVAPMATVIESLPDISPAVSQHADNEWDSLAVLPPPVNRVFAERRSSPRGRLILLAVVGTVVLGIAAATTVLTLQWRSTAAALPTDDDPQLQANAAGKESPQPPPDVSSRADSQVKADAHVDAETANEATGSPVNDPMTTSTEPNAEATAEAEPDVKPDAASPEPATVPNEAPADLFAALPMAFDLNKDVLQKAGGRAELKSSRVLPIANCSLSLIGGDSVLGSNWRLFLEHGNATHNQKEFKVMSANAKLGVAGAPFQLATILLREDGLAFTGKSGLLPQKKQQAAQLGNCILRLTANDGAAEHFIAMREPVAAQTIQIGFGISPTYTPLDLSPWPENTSVQPRLEVPTPPPPFGDYVIEQTTETSVTMKSDRPYMPEFKMAVNPERKSMEYSCIWPVLENSRHPSQSIDLLYRELQDTRMKKSKSQTQLQNQPRGETPNQLTERTGELKRINDEIATIDQQLAAVQRAGELSKLRIPFSIAITLEEKHKILVANTSDQGGGQRP